MWQSRAVFQERAKAALSAMERRLCPPCWPRLLAGAALLASTSMTASLLQVALALVERVLSSPSQKISLVDASEVSESAPTFPRRARLEGEPSQANARTSESGCIAFQKYMPQSAEAAVLCTAVLLCDFALK